MDAIIRNIQARYAVPRIARTVRYERRIFAFLDILGWSKLIELSLKDKVAMRRLAGLQVLFRLDSELHDKLQGPEDSFRTHFSDTLIMSWPAPKSDKQSALVLQDLAAVLLQLFANCFLVRGGVVLGKVLHRRDIVFGPALVDAYKLETRVAIYPRVVVGTSLRAWRQSPFVQQDADGQWFINFLPCFKPGYRFPEFLGNVRRFLTGEYAHSKNDPSTSAKYAWMMSYLNRVLRDHDIRRVKPIKLGNLN